MTKTNVVSFPVKPQASNVTRALCTFVFSTLVGPAIAAALMVTIYLVSGALGIGPPSLRALKPSELLSLAAQRGLEGYIWSAIPAGLAGAALAALVYIRGNFHWLAGVIAAAVAATLMAVLSGGQATIHITFIALMAAVTAVLGRLVLVKARVVG